MRVYRAEVMVVDFEDYGEEHIKACLEIRHGEILPEVMSMQSRDIGEWSDDHPLNFIGKDKVEFNRLFNQG
jgi:endonuclease YncB( thermonuclease family)